MSKSWVDRALAVLDADAPDTVVEAAREKSGQVRQPDDLDDALRQVFRDAVRMIEEVLFHGMLEHINRKHRDTWTAILQAEEEMETVWRQVEAGSSTLDRFREVVARWRDLHVAMGQEHAAKTCADCEQDKAGM